MKSWIASGNKAINTNEMMHEPSNCNSTIRVRKQIHHPLKTRLDFAEHIHSETEHVNQKVLGKYWDTHSDQFHFAVRLNLNAKKRGVRPGPVLQLADVQHGMPMKLTTRLVVSRVNRLYDPLGLVSPFIIRAKNLMRKL